MLRQTAVLLLLLVVLTTAQDGSGSGLNTPSSSGSGDPAGSGKPVIHQLPYTSGRIRCFLDNGLDMMQCDEDVEFCYTSVALVSAKLYTHKHNHTHKHILLCTFTLSHTHTLTHMLSGINF